MAHANKTGTEKNGMTGEKFADFADMAGVRVITDIERSSSVRNGIRNFTGHLQAKYLPVNWPVTMMREHLDLIETSPYVARCKPDGPRYLLFVDEDGNVFMENNAGNIFEFDKDHALQIVDYRGRPLTNTLLDGIVTLPVSYSDSPKKNSRAIFLVHDALYCNGRDLKSLGVTQRIKFADDEIMKPRLHMIKSGLIDIGSEPFDLDIAQYVQASQAEKYLQGEFLSEQKYDFKSIIFYPVHERYIPVIPKSLLNWDFKPDVEFDFLLNKGDLYVTSHKGKMSKYGTIVMNDELRQFGDGCIITCIYTDHQWVFMRRRYDRKHPNARKTVNRICPIIYVYHSCFLKISLLCLLGKFRAVTDPVRKERLLTSLEKSQGQE